MAQFEDELEDIAPEPKKPAAAAKATTAKSAAASAPAIDEEEETPAPAKVSVKATTKSTTEKPAAKAVEEDDDDLDVEFGDQKVMAKGDGLNRIRAEKNKVVRFAILPFITPKSAKSHFVEVKDKKGNYRCLTKNDAEELGYCCTKLDEEGMLHVVALAVQYTNADAKTGRYEKGSVIEWEVGYVDLSRTNYRSVSNLAPEETPDGQPGSVYDIDIVMSKKVNGIGYEFTMVSPKARWKQNPELAKEVEAAANKLIRDGGKKLISRLGRKETLLGWKALLAGTATSAEEASLEDVEDL